MIRQALLEYFEYLERNFGGVFVQFIITKINRKPIDIRSFVEELSPMRLREVFNTFGWTSATAEFESIHARSVPKPFREINLEWSNLYSSISGETASNKIKGGLPKTRVETDYGEDIEYIYNVKRVSSPREFWANPTGERVYELDTITNFRKKYPLLKT